VDSFDTITSQGAAIARLFGLELGISALLLALVVGWLVLALLRFRARPGDTAEPRQVHGNTRLEIAWTVAPAVVLAVVFVLVIQTMMTVTASPPQAQPVRVIGHQWWWEYEFPDRQAITANELHVPVGSALQLSLESVDVIHDFHVPEFGWMKDTIPGKTNSMSILVERPGRFDGACNQYCGAQHAWMRVDVFAEPLDQWTAWAQQQALAVTPTGSPGEQVFLNNTCVSCHSIRGLSAGPRVGPDLTHLGSRATLGTGVVDNTPDNLRRWIQNAGSIKPGVLMPPYPNLSAADLAALTDYLSGLR
jgi:cytochrome c oxidase subunit 2